MFYQKICTWFGCVVLTPGKNVAHIRLAFRTFCSLFNFMCILKCSAIGSYCRLFFYLFRLCHQLAVYRTHTHISPNNRRKNAKKVLYQVEECFYVFSIISRRLFVDDWQASKFSASQIDSFSQGLNWEALSTQPTKSQFHTLKSVRTERVWKQIALQSRKQ